ncbi:hypothetical protein M885DRAFT_611293 [Pelagophyceae sp. CCMP2097]|nr:hypothetical protein M885DRAFT_611293 [Pelagophyceae sp. CCMP2097]
MQAMLAPRSVFACGDWCYAGAGVHDARDLSKEKLWHASWLREDEALWEGLDGPLGGPPWASTAAAAPGGGGDAAPLPPQSLTSKLSKRPPKASSSPPPARPRSLATGETPRSLSTGETPLDRKQRPSPPASANFFAVSQAAAAADEAHEKPAAVAVRRAAGGAQGHGGRRGGGAEPAEHAEQFAFDLSGAEEKHGIGERSIQRAYRDRLGKSITLEQARAKKGEIGADPQGFVTKGDIERMILDEQTAPNRGIMVRRNTAERNAVHTLRNNLPQGGCLECFIPLMQPPPPPPPHEVWTAFTPVYSDIEKLPAPSRDVQWRLLAMELDAGADDASVLGRVSELSERGLSAVDPETGATLIMHLAEAGSEAVLKEVLSRERLRDICNARDCNGFAAIDYARHRGRHKIADILSTYSHPSMKKLRRRANSRQKSTAAVVFRQRSDTGLRTADSGTGLRATNSGLQRMARPLPSSVSQASSVWKLRTSTFG